MLPLFIHNIIIHGPSLCLPWPSPSVLLPQPHAVISTHSELKSNKLTFPTLSIFITPSSYIIQARTMSSTTTAANTIANSNASASSRWCPTPEQLMILEELYKSGVRTPNAPQIQRITAHLSLYGKIEGKNVFYWFQNHKARDRQKLRRKLLKQFEQQQQHNHLQLCHHQLINNLPPDHLHQHQHQHQHQHHQTFDDARRHLLLNYFDQYPNHSPTTTTSTPRFHHLPNPPLPPPPHQQQQVGRSGVAVEEGGASSREMLLMTMTMKKNQTWNDDNHHQRHHHDHVEHMIPAGVGFGGCQMAAAEDNSTVMAGMCGPDRRWITAEADEGNDDHHHDYDNLERNNSHRTNPIKTLQLFPVTSTNLIQDRSRSN